MELPPLIPVGTAASFPGGVFNERHPKLVEQVIAAHPYGERQRRALRQLLAESTSGVVARLAGEPADGPRWAEWGREWWGRPWSETPFLWAESYFYRRLLAAVEYFEPGIWHAIDPFAPAKNAELSGPEVEAELAALAELADAADRDTVGDALVRSALWGNQADLGFRLTGGSEARTALLADDTAFLWERLAAAEHPTVTVIADNAGRELLPDLVLIDHLLTARGVRAVALHLKPQPYYVSDATMADLLTLLERLCGHPGEHIRRIGVRLRAAIAGGVLSVRTHPFYCSPLEYRDMPGDLARELAGSTITVLKGDLNYRRLVGDRYWPATTEFATCVDYFPSPVLALRTAKSDVAVGLSAARVAELDAGEPRWRTSGEHAVIHAAPPGAVGGRRYCA
ncbi:MAG TPA: damage-control phosphatase ARMT1 family protein [Nocardia sp.]|uniref:damage-control phosphatase ARMT1 family protein n=1 Tax=Nocardia TaxID=1817 RepID=UPI002458F7BB|nr:MULTISPECIES: damage-control phosphatase ARMT1 family protein [Nocardia]HLS75442.1 damage-control phosphatase ARMT1 family protein [Nocardia sp.]